MQIDEGDLDIPASNREIALHLRNIISRLDNLESQVSGIQEGMNQRRFKAQDLWVGSLLLPLLGGTLLFIVTKALG
jgi:hypothetical protein